MQCPMPICLAMGILTGVNEFRPTRNTWLAPNSLAAKALNTPHGPGPDNSHHLVRAGCGHEPWTASTPIANGSATAAAFRSTSGGNLWLNRGLQQHVLGKCSVVCPAKDLLVRADLEIPVPAGWACVADFQGRF